MPNSEPVRGSTVRWHPDGSEKLRVSDRDARSNPQGVALARVFSISAELFRRLRESDPQLGIAKNTEPLVCAGMTLGDLGQCQTYHSAERVTTVCSRPQLEPPPGATSLGYRSDCDEAPNRFCRRLGDAPDLPRNCRQPAPSGQRPTNRFGGGCTGRSALAGSGPFVTATATSWRGGTTASAGDRRSSGREASRCSRCLTAM